MNLINLVRLAPQATIFVLIAALAGCAASGPPFAGPEKPASGGAMLYLYRPSAFVQSGNVYAVSFVPSAQTLKVRNGSWVQAGLPPGRFRLDAVDQFGAMRCGALSLELVAGETAYAMLDVSLRGDGSGRNVHGCQIVRATPEKALHSMAGMPRSE